MSLDKLIGAGDFKFVSFPMYTAEKIFEEHSILSPHSRNFFLASFAEFGLLHTAAEKTPKIPLKLPGSLVPHVTYRTNTYTYDCGYDKGEGTDKSEYIFLFTSDCWKVREILHHENPFYKILEQPLEVRDRILESRWEIVPPKHNPRNLVSDLCLLLWCVKAHLLKSPNIPDQIIEQVTLSLFKDMNIKERL